MFGWLKKNKCKHEAVKFETVGLYLRSLTGDMPHYEELLVDRCKTCHCTARYPRVGDFVAVENPIYGLSEYRVENSMMKTATTRRGGVNDGEAAL